MTRSNRMKFRLRDFCNGANLRWADLERRAVHLISLRSKCFRAVSEQRTAGEQESKTVQKMGHFLVLVPFFARPKLKISFLVVPWSFFAPSLKKTLATKAACFNSC